LQAQASSKSSRFPRRRLQEEDLLGWPSISSRHFPARFFGLHWRPPWTGVATQPFLGFDDLQLGVLARRLCSRELALEPLEVCQ